MFVCSCAGMLLVAMTLVAVLMDTGAAAVVDMAAGTGAREEAATGRSYAWVGSRLAVGGWWLGCLWDRHFRPKGS